MNEALKAAHPDYVGEMLDIIYEATIELFKVRITEASDGALFIEYREHNSICWKEYWAEPPEIDLLAHILRDLIEKSR